MKPLFYFSCLFFCACTAHLKENEFPGVRFSGLPQREAFRKANNDFNNDEEVLKITSKDVDTVARAKELISKKTDEITLMFAPQMVPYLGEITKSTACTSQIEINHKLLDTETEVSIYFNLTATERFIYGACIPEQEKYKSQLLMLYCPKIKKLFEFKYFYDRKTAFVEQIAHCE